MRKGRKRHIMVDTLDLPNACGVEPANISDQRAGSLLLGGLVRCFPTFAPSWLVPDMKAGSWPLDPSRVLAATGTSVGLADPVPTNGSVFFCP
jgi:hypothetical protein